MMFICTEKYNKLRNDVKKLCDLTYSERAELSKVNSRLLELDRIFNFVEIEDTDFLPIGFVNEL